MTNLETNFLEVFTRKAVRFCSRAVRRFPAPLAQMRTALIWDFRQWFCKESARRAVRVIIMIKQGIKQIVKIKRLAVHKHEKDRKKRNLKSAIFHVHRAINKFI